MSDQITTQKEPMKLTHTLILLACSVLASCATTKSPEVIDYTAKLHFFSDRCASNSLMDMETAAKGISIASGLVSSSDVSRVNEKLGDYRSRYPRVTQQQCNDTRLHILSRAASSTQQAPAPAYRPITTNCSTNFGYTHCTTF